MSVKFNHAWPVGAHYNKGDVAKFEADVEKDLIERKIADKYTPAKSAESSEPAK